MNSLPHPSWPPELPPCRRRHPSWRPNFFLIHHRCRCRCRRRRRLLKSDETCPILFVLAHFSKIAVFKGAGRSDKLDKLSREHLIEMGTIGDGSSEGPGFELRPPKVHSSLI